MKLPGDNPKPHLSPYVHGVIDAILGQRLSTEFQLVDHAYIAFH